MRRVYQLTVSGAVLSVLMLTISSASAENLRRFDDGTEAWSSYDCDPCGTAAGRRCKFRHHVYIEGLDPAFNCGCNGSYKFPVPPLYTYHWPGIYSHQLMTDYHSPWRFPPLKPYSDEPAADADGAAEFLKPVPLRSVSTSAASGRKQR